MVFQILLISVFFIILLLIVISFLRQNKKANYELLLLSDEGNFDRMLVKYTPIFNLLISIGVLGSLTYPTYKINQMNIRIGKTLEILNPKIPYAIPREEIKNSLFNGLYQVEFQENFFSNAIKDSIHHDSIGVFGESLLGMLDFYNNHTKIQLNFYSTDSIQKIERFMFDSVNISMAPYKVKACARTIAIDSIDFDYDVSDNLDTIFLKNEGITLPLLKRDYPK